MRGDGPTTRKPATNYTGAEYSPNGNFALFIKALRTLTGQAALR